jgi:hypothetical protein
MKNKHIEVSFLYDGAYCNVDGKSMAEVMMLLKDGAYLPSSWLIPDMRRYCENIELTMHSLGWSDVIVGYPATLMTGQYENFCHGGRLYVKIHDHREMICVYRIIVKEVRLCMVQ